MSLDKHPKLSEALGKFAQEYVKNPFKYLYEVDVQVLLAKHLELIFNEKHELHAQVQKNGNQKFDIGKVHREYPRYKLTKPIDNVVLGKPRQFTSKELLTNTQYENFYEQPIEYAIELKFVYFNEIRNRLNASINDYIRFIDNKLKPLEQDFEFRYGIQLTVFQSLHEQNNKFLGNVLKNGWWDFAIYFVTFLHYLKRK